MSAVINFVAALTVVLLPDTRRLNRPQLNDLQDTQEPIETQPLLPQPDRSHNDTVSIEPGSSPLYVSEEEDDDDETNLSGERVGYMDVLRTAKREFSVELEALRSFSLVNKNVSLCLLVLFVTRLGSSSIEI